MKGHSLRLCLLGMGLLLAAFTIRAQTPAAEGNSETPVSGDVSLPYGAQDVLKLSRAHISDDVILNYIHDAGTVYHLAPKDIVYLRNEGVSEVVLNAMIDQRAKAVEASQASQASQTSDQSVASYPDFAIFPVAPIYSPIYLPPQPLVIQRPTPVSTVFVIPYSGHAYPRYIYPRYSGWYGYYGGYYAPGYCAPGGSFVVTIGGGHGRFGVRGHFSRGLHR